MFSIIQNRAPDTVKIVSDDTDHGYAIINAADFDVDTMTPFGSDDPLPSTRALPDVLDTMTDVDAITAMSARDPRKSTAAVYTARLAALNAK